MATLGINSVTGGRMSPPVTDQRWISYFAWFMLLAAFAFYLVTAIVNPPFAQAHIQLLKEGDFRAGAYFYTDVEQVRTAEIYFRDADRFAPRQVQSLTGE